jgi:hypothetical protein
MDSSKYHSQRGFTVRQHKIRHSPTLDENILSLKAKIKGHRTRRTSIFMHRYEVLDVTNVHDNNKLELNVFCSTNMSKCVQIH